MKFLYEVCVKSMNYTPEKMLSHFLSPLARGFWLFYELSPLLRGVVQSLTKGDLGECSFRLTIIKLERNRDYGSWCQLTIISS